MRDIPTVLVETWVKLYTNGEMPVVRQRAYDMIRNNFRSLNEAKDYIKQKETSQERTIKVA